MPLHSNAPKFVLSDTKYFGVYAFYRLIYEVYRVQICMQRDFDMQTAPGIVKWPEVYMNAAL